MAADAVKVIANNKKAFHDYFIEEKFEAGIELAGTEVKSLRLGNVNLKDSFCLISGLSRLPCRPCISVPIDQPADQLRLCQRRRRLHLEKIALF